MVNIAVRADSGPAIGIGHVVRCLSLATELDKHGECAVSFITRNRDQIGDFNTIHLKTQYESLDNHNYQFQSINNELGELQEILKQNTFDVLIVDNYGIDDNYFRQLRQYIRIIVLLEDFGKFYPEVDMVINGAYYADTLGYRNNYCLLGNKYVLLREEFKKIGKRPVNTICKKIAITSGGSDPLKFCDTIAIALKGYYPFIKKSIIIGNCFEDITSLKQLVSEDSSFQLIFNADMESIMLDMDLVITASGGTLYELAATGTPSISYILFYDQKRIGECMGAAGVTKNMGKIIEFSQQSFRDEFDKLLSDVDVRMEMSHKGRQLIDGRGSERAAESIVQMFYEMERQ